MTYKSLVVLNVENNGQKGFLQEYGKQKDVSRLSTKIRASISVLRFVARLKYGVCKIRMDVLKGIYGS